MAQNIYVAPDSAAVVDGYLVPGQNFVKAVIDQLRQDMHSDTALQQRFQQDPRSVLGERGIIRPLQDEIMSEQGIPIQQAMGWCISTGSCCCQTLQ